MRQTKKPYRKLNLEFLETHEDPIAKLWRFCRGQERTAREIQTEFGERGLVFNYKQRLVKTGWMTQSAVRLGRHGYVYLAVVNEAPEQVPLHKRLPEMRDRLTDLAAMAEAARKTGLVRKMAEALAEVEKTAREIRDSLRVLL